MTIPHTTKAELLGLLEQKGLHSSKLALALEQSEKSHSTQLRDNGNSYLEEHIYSVAKEFVLSYGDKSVPEDAVIAALLHDAIEDDPNYSYAICDKQFGKNIADLVLSLTKTPDENVSADIVGLDKKLESDRKYMQRVINGPGEAVIIKLADFYCNLASVITIKNTNPGKYKRYLMSAKETFLPLAKANSRYFYKKLDNLYLSLSSGS